MRAVCMFFLLLVFTLSANGDTTEYTVSTQEEFLNAIGPDRTIVIAEGEIIIVEIPRSAEGERPVFPSSHPNQYLEWESVYDGVSLMIYGVENLTIRGSGELASSILTEPRYSFVMDFHGCSGIHIENLVIGHTPDGFCDKGVLAFVFCTDVAVDGCDLFGCGVLGLDLERTRGFTFSNSVIRDCTYGIMVLRNSGDLLFENSVFIDNEEFFGVEMIRCTDVVLQNCLFENNITNPYSALFDFTFCENITLQDCIIRDNTCEELFSDIEAIKLIDVALENNRLTAD